MRAGASISSRIIPAFVTLVAVLATPALPAAPAAGSADPERTLEGGFVQEEEINLILIDVKAAGRPGEPLRGLTREDFTLRLDGRLWPVYSVDEHCPPMPSAGSGLPPGGTVASTRPGPPAPDAPPTSGARDPATGEPRRFVLYFDFSSLMQDGLIHAREASMSWVRNVRRGDEPVEVVAYSTPAGLRVLLPWSADGTRLEAAVRDAFEDRDLLDAWPAEWTGRIEQCLDCVDYRCSLPAGHDIAECGDQCPECYSNARSDLRHGQWAFEAMRHYLTLLAETPGTKSILLFTQSTVLSPGRFYVLEDPDTRIGTHFDTLEKVGAAATEARASFYPIHAGNNQFDNDFATPAGSNPGSVELASLLAEFTGGGYGRGPSDTARTMSEAGREVACTYRLAFRPPDEKRTRTWSAEVRAAGVSIPWTYRVQHLSDEDRTMRRARALLAGATRDTSIRVAAAIQPRRAGARKWTVAVQVALEAGSLEALPVGSRAETHLDVGALLEDVERGWSREFLGGSEVLRSRGTAGGGALLFDHVIEGLRPGRYRVRAFVHNRSLDQSGRAEASILLPHPDRSGIAGPLASMPGRRVYRSYLPLMGEEGEATGIAVPAGPDSPPLGPGAVRRGEPLRMSTWICPGREPVSGRLIRYIERDGVPVFQAGIGWVGEAGRCEQVDDLIHTVELEPGHYTYRVVREGEVVRPRQGEAPWTVAFEIVDPGAGSGLVRGASE